jgi:cytidine deaminase
MKAKLKQAHAAAKSARDNAYAPYSKFKVGASIVLDNGEIISGCNVENASYGATICAERNAFFAAVAKFGKIQPKAIVLVTEPEAVPCGLCLQVMAEFCKPNCEIYLGTSKKLGKSMKLNELLTHPFGPEALK